MEGLNYLGAVTTGLASQYITLRVKSIDTDRLRGAIGGGAGTMAASALTLIDTSPKAALDVAIPVVLPMLRNKYGIDADVSITTVAPKGKRAASEFWPGALVGLIVGGSSLAIWKLLSKAIG